MGCGMSIRGQKNGLTALKNFQDEEAVFLQEERTRWERTKDWVSMLEDVPEEDMASSKVQLGTWLCREMDKVLDKGERLSRGKNQNSPVPSVPWTITGGKQSQTEDSEASIRRREVTQEETEHLVANQERLMSMLFRVDAMRYQQYVQENAGRLKWREVVEGRNQGLKRSGSTRDNARTIMFSVMKASRAALVGEKGKAKQREEKENSPEQWPKSEGSTTSSSAIGKSEEALEEVPREEVNQGGGGRRQSEAVSDGKREDVEVINRETQDAFVRLQICMGARKNLRKEFNMMDSREEKTITMNEFLFACYAMGTGLNKREITLVFKFIDTRGQGELSFDEFMAAFDLKSRLVRRMSQMEDGMQAMLHNTHQHSSMPGMAKKGSGMGNTGKRRSFSMPTNSMLKLQIADMHKSEDEQDADHALERSATSAALETGNQAATTAALETRAKLHGENTAIRQSC